MLCVCGSNARPVWVPLKQGKNLLGVGIGKYRCGVWGWDGGSKGNQPSEPHSGGEGVGGKKGGSKGSRPLESVRPEV